MKRGILLLIISPIMMFLQCVGKNKGGESCCGKIRFYPEVRDGRPNKIMECGSEEKISFCFEIKNPTFLPFDKSCKSREVNATYFVDYGDGTTEAVSGKEPFCHLYGKGSYVVSITSIPQIEGCDESSYFTGKLQVSVTECPLPIVKDISNSCSEEKWVEMYIEQACILHIEASDIWNQPLTYCWDMDGDGVFETCSSVPEITFEGKKIGTYNVTGMVFNSCGCSRSGPSTTFVVLPVVETLSSAIAMELGVSDVFPQGISDELFLYISTSASPWLPTIGAVPKTPSILLYHAPLTAPWEATLFEVYHGNEVKGQLEYSENGYLHMNGEGGGVYVFAATYPYVFTPVVVPSMPLWKNMNGDPFKPSAIFVESVTGFLIEEKVAYSVDISDPLNIKETDRLIEIINCGALYGIYSHLPWVFALPETVMSPSCGIGVYDFSDGLFGETPYQYPPPVPALLLSITECSDTNYCKPVKITGTRRRTIENDLLVPDEYPDDGTAVLTLSSFSTGRKEEIDIFCKGATEFKVDDSIFNLYDRKRIVLPKWFYENYPKSGWTYSATYTVPEIIFAGINRMENYNYSGRIRMWDILPYNNSITSEISSEFLLFNDVEGLVAFQGEKVLACSSAFPQGMSTPQYLEVIDFSDPYYPSRITSLEIRESHKLEGCLRMRKFEEEDVKTAFVATGSALGIVDLSDLNSPQVKRVINFSGRLMEVNQYSKNGKNYLIISLGRSGLVIYDVTDLLNPLFVSSFENGKTMGRFVRKEEFLYIIADEGIDIISLGDLSHPALVTSFVPSHNYPNCITMEGNFLYAGGRDYLLKIDVSDPSSPLEVSFAFHEGVPEKCVVERGLIVTLSDAGRFYFYRGEPLGYTGQFQPVVGSSPEAILLKDGILYIGSKGYITIYDVSDPASPVFLSLTFLGNIYNQVEEMALLNNFLFLAVDYDAIDGVNKGYGFVYDVSNPLNPLMYAKFNAYDVNRVFVREEGGFYYIFLGAYRHNTIEMYKTRF